MPTYRYQALNADQQSVSGEVVAESVAAAVTSLQSTGLAVQSISLVTVAQSPTSDQIDQPAVPAALTDETNSALRAHMARVLEQGREIAPALAAYAQEMPRGRRRRQLQTVVDVLNRGDTAEAANTLSELPEYWIPLLSAASSSHDAGRVLREFLDDSRRSDELYRQWWLTFAYPLFIIAMAIGVCMALSYFVIPVFASIFRDFRMDLPGLTRVALYLSSLLIGENFYLAAPVSLILIVLVIGAWRLLPIILPSSIVDRVRWPFGRTSAIARFTRFTADLLEGGLQLPEALRIAGEATKRRDVRIAASTIAAETAAGVAPSPGSLPLTAAVLFALRSNMATPARVRLLRELSNCLATRARIRLSWTRGIIEPLSICIVGGIVCALAVALFLPLIRLINSLS
jgi:type IV pilus assembly protein PilC